MTLNTRNRFLLTLFVISISFLLIFSIISLIFFIKGDFSSTPKFERLLPIESENFLLKNSPISSVFSNLMLLLYVSISCYFLYTSFEKTKSPETIYLMGFFIGCLLQSLKILVVILKLWDTSSYILILLSRIEIVGRLFAPICLLFTAMFTDIEKLQEADRNIGLTLGISAFVASILPINSTKIYSNFTLYCGFESCIIFFIFFCALITIIAFIFTSKQREIPFWISPTPYFVVMYFGYIILTTTDDFLALFLGSILLGFGSCGILSKLHKYYLWK